MGDISRRGLLVTGAWAAPVIAVAIVSPAAVASGDMITLVWTPSPVKYFETTTLVVSVPAGSPYVGEVATLRILGFSGTAIVKTVLTPWQTSFPDSLPFQAYVPPSNTLPEGQFVFQIQFAYNFPINSVQYHAQLVDDQNRLIAGSSPLTITE